MALTPTSSWLEAVQEARSEVTKNTAPPPRLWYGLCLVFVRSMHDVPSLFGSAKAAWTHAGHQHTSKNPPAGAPVYWSGGTYGHIALSTGNGRCISTDIRRKGRPNEVDINTIRHDWGLRYLGWTEDLNGRPVDFQGKITPKPPSKGAAAAPPNTTIAVKALEMARQGEPISHTYYADARQFVAWGRALGAIPTTTEHAWNVYHNKKPRNAELFSYAVRCVQAHFKLPQTGAIDKTVLDKMKGYGYTIVGSR